MSTNIIIVSVAGNGLSVTTDWLGTLNTCKYNLRFRRVFVGLVECSGMGLTAFSLFSCFQETMGPHFPGTSFCRSPTGLVVKVSLFCFN